MKTKTFVQKTGVTVKLHKLEKQMLKDKEKEITILWDKICDVQTYIQNNFGTLTSENKKTGGKSFDVPKYMFDLMGFTQTILREIGYISEKLYKKDLFDRK